jgi:tetratricopeptide (TPR) repeat protein
LGRLKEAVYHWRRASRLDASLSIAARNLGLYYWTKGNDPQQAATWYQKAIAARPADQTLYRDLAELLLDQGDRSTAIELLETMPHETIRRADIIVMLAQAYLDAKQYTKAIELLAATPYFVNWEGSSVTRDIFVKAHLERGQVRFARDDFAAALKDFNAALTYPENLGVGKTNTPEDAAALYWKGKALHAVGQIDAARAAWQAAADSPAGSDRQNHYRKLARETLQ